MTSIQSSLIPSYSSAISNASQLSSELLSDQLGLQPSQNTANNIFGGSYSIDLSDAAMDALGGSGNADSSLGSNSATNMLSALTYSNFSTNTQGDSSYSIEALFNGLEGLNSGSASAPVVPTSLSGSSFEQATLADGGPLPAFLAYVDQAMNLSPTQQASLQNIANENMDIPGDTPAVVQQIATELQQAGIPETI